MGNISRVQVIQAYRALLRACRSTFQSDVPALAAAMHEARNRFEQSRHLQDEHEIRQKVSEAHEAVSFLNANIVQATCANLQCLHLLSPSIRWTHRFEEPRWTHLYVIRFLSWE